MNAVTVAGVISTLLFLGSNLPMVVHAIKSRDVSSYSRINLLMVNSGNAIYTVYVLSLPAGPSFHVRGKRVGTGATAAGARRLAGRALRPQLRRS